MALWDAGNIVWMDLGDAQVGCASAFSKLFFMECLDS